MLLHLLRLLLLCPLLLCLELLCLQSPLLVMVLPCSWALPLLVLLQRVLLPVAGWVPASEASKHNEQLALQELGNCLTACRPFAHSMPLTEPAQLHTVIH
jgi:hypothetical protein